MACVNGFTFKFGPVAVFEPFVQLYVYAEFGPATSNCADVFTQADVIELTKATVGRAFTVSVFAAVLVHVPTPAITFTV